MRVDLHILEYAYWPISIIEKNREWRHNQVPTCSMHRFTVTSYQLAHYPSPHTRHTTRHKAQQQQPTSNRAMTLLARWRAAVRMVRAVRHAEQSLSLLLCAYCSLHIGHNDTYVSASRGFKCRAPAGRSRRPSTRSERVARKASASSILAPAEVRASATTTLSHHHLELIVLHHIKCSTQRVKRSTTVWGPC